uniref:major facilitator superfamily domain-containing protein 3-like isoform X1 n=1 Tax=Myxine glutinosa TaxID=7769 RepID=UPI00358E5364
MVREKVQQAEGWRLPWLALMYTVQGLPYGLQTGLLPAGLRASGYSLSAVSLSRLLFVPWLCKPLIAPIVERSRRTWLLGSLMSLTGVFIIAAMLPHVAVDLPHQGEQAGVPTSLIHLMPLLVMLNTFAAAHDVVVDGCAVTMLEGNAELGQGNAVQVVFYKLGSLFSGGVLLWALPALTWPGAMLCLAFACAVSSAISLRYPSHANHVFRGTSELGGPPISVHDVFLGANMRGMAVFVLLYKLGEQGAQSTFPLLLLDRGFNTKELGLYVSSPATILSLFSSSLAAPLLASYSNCCGNHFGGAPSWRPADNTHVHSHDAVCAGHVRTPSGDMLQYIVRIGALWEARLCIHFGHCSGWHWNWTRLPLIFASRRAATAFAKAYSLDKFCTRTQKPKADAKDLWKILAHWWLRNGS